MGRREAQVQIICLVALFGLVLGVVVVSIQTGVPAPGRVRAHSKLAGDADMGIAIDQAGVTEEEAAMTRSEAGATYITALVGGTLGIVGVLLDPNNSSWTSWSAAVSLIGLALLGAAATLVTWRLWRLLLRWYGLRRF